MDFTCLYKWKNGRKEQWSGKIAKIIEYDGFIEMNIMSRSSIWVIVGKGERGYWACVPDYNAGCGLGYLGDVFYNTERLISALKNKVDAITVAEALRVLSKEITF